MKIIVIAEAGVNHNGDIDVAKKLINIAADAGADFIKFQTFVAEKLVTYSAPKAKYQSLITGDGESQFQMLKKLELSESMHCKLIDHCSRKNIKFLSTAFDIDSVKLLARMGQNIFKIPSGEITNLPYLRQIGRLQKEVYLSTGMANLGDIEAAINVLESEGTPRSSMVVMHCTSEYPSPIHEVNLSAIESMRSAFGVRVGYSDHTIGIEVAIAAAAIGACIIEKHITLDNKSPGPDHKASLEPYEFVAMVNAIRNIELAMGDGIKRVTLSEEKNRVIARKSIVAASSIKIGERFTSHNIITKRPGTGISPMHWDDVIGRIATRNYVADDLIEL